MAKKQKMDKYLFLFYGSDILMGWECFDPEEPISEAMAVQQAFNMLQSEMFYNKVSVYAYGSCSSRLLICSMVK